MSTGLKNKHILQGLSLGYCTLVIQIARQMCIYINQMTHSVWGFTFLWDLPGQLLLTELDQVFLSLQSQLSNSSKMSQIIFIKMKRLNP